jgi:putative colanic acid biosynthesis acetyltransferase WcaF
MSRDLSVFQNFARNSLLWKLRVGSWNLVSEFLVSNFLVSSQVRVSLLRLFGAKIGKNCLVRRNTRIYFPWNLVIGTQTWLGENVQIINHEFVYIGSNVCISQSAVICSSGHDYRSASLEYDHRPIEIKDGAWICLGATVLSGVTIGECSVVSAGEVARKSLPDYSMLVGGQVHPIDPPR